jgi:hypothetical protein
MINSTFEQQARERERILAALRELADSNDPETAHSRADYLLIEYLRLIGADDIADAWANAPK